MKASIIESKRFKELVAYVRKATDNNNHSKALIKVAEFLGLKDFQEQFEVYENKDYISIEDYNNRHTLREAMFIVIRCKHGEQAVKRLEEVM